MKNKLLRKKVFTLVELIIVIAIIAILAVSAGLMLIKGQGAQNTSCSATGSTNYGLTVQTNATYSGTNYAKIIYLDNTNIACSYKALHDKDNFTGTVAFVLSGDLDFSSLSTGDYTSLNSGYDYTGNTFAPIGSSSHKFNADFYGNNHKIIVGDINYANDNDIGFFGYVGSSGKIYNLQLKIGDVSGSDDVGGFVGRNDGTIENSSAVVNSVKGGSDEVGGFVGENDSGTITNSSVVVDSVSGSYYIGGFVGENDGTIENSSAVVNSVKGGSDEVGGFVGENAGTIENSSAVVDSVSGSYYVGGFVGESDNDGTIENSSAVVDSVSGSYYVGGFVGWNYYGTIENSSAVVNSVKGGSNNVGGFVGWNVGTIENSSAVVNSVSGGDVVGGFVGENDNLAITNSVSRVLVLDGASSNVSAGYYSNNNSAGNSTNINKQEFFFGDSLNNSENDGLSYDGTTLTITSPTSNIFDNSHFPSAFGVGGGTNWGDTIITNLSSYWNTTGW